MNTTNMRQVRGTTGSRSWSERNTWWEHLGQEETDRWNRFLITAGTHDQDTSCAGRGDRRDDQKRN